MRCMRWGGSIGGICDGKSERLKDRKTERPEVRKSVGRV
jgi:hypothetical protein